MEHPISIRQMSKSVWHQVCKNAISWAVLCAGLLCLCALNNYVLKDVQGLSILFLALQAFYSGMLCNNALDTVYGRKLSMFAVSCPLLIAASFNFGLNVLAMPIILAEKLGIDASVFPTAILFVELFIFYMIWRCFFVSFAMLENKLSLMEACKKSYRFTRVSYALNLLSKIFLALFVISACLIACILAIMLSPLHDAAIEMFKNIGQGESSLNIIPIMVIGAIFHCYVILLSAAIFKKLDESVR